MTLRGCMRRRMTAFTLTELLIVLAVLFVLLAIMMPSLNLARRLARTARCGANLRAIDQAMLLYATENQGAILGNAHTTSAFLYRPAFDGLAPGISEAANVPFVISSNDWLTPTAQIMGQSFNGGGTPADRSERFMQLNAFKAFICPDNDVVSTAYTGDGGPNFPVHRMISYNTALCFQYVNGTGDNSATLAAGFVDLGGYRPNLQLVGNAAQKVYIADGGRWWNGSGTLAPDTNGAVLGASPGGMTSDYGPWNRYSRSYLKGPNADGRTASMRHGERRPAASLARFKFNLAFFDGHVEALSGLDGANPSLWVPQGGKPTAGEYVKDADFLAKYGSDPVIE
jgi:prepilin-type processing-associated H-X9-DG protein